MPLLRPLRLAPHGPASNRRTDTGLAGLGDADLLEPLGTSIASFSSSLIALRLSAWDGLQRTFPRPGHAAAAAGLALASATMASLALLALATAPEAEPTPSPAFELGAQPGVVNSGVPGPAAVDPAAVDPTAVVFSSPPATEPNPESGQAAAEGQARTHAHGAAPVGAAPQEDGLSRISPATHQATTPLAPGPVPEPSSEPSPEPAPKAPRLHRLSRSEVLAVTPAAPLVTPGDTPVAAVVPTDVGALPLGKGMWLYVPGEIEGGSVDALVARAQQVGLTHVYVRTGSSRGGFYAQRYMDELLPKAHAAGLRVYGWDFPYLDDVDADVTRAVAAVTYTTLEGDRIDGFAADIETASEGTNLSAEGAAAYGQRLREAVGPAYPLVAVVPRPSTQMQARYP